MTLKTHAEEYFQNKSYMPQLFTRKFSPREPKCTIMLCPLHLMRVRSLGSVLSHRPVETGMGNDLPGKFQPSRIGFDLDIAMLFVAVNGSKSFTTLNCKNYFNVLITVEAKDDAGI